MATKKRKSSGRTSEQKTALCTAIFQRMHYGQSLRSACESEGVPQGTAMEWIATDSAIADQYARARQALLAHMEADILEIADAPVGTNDRGGVDAGAVQKQRLQVDTRKWLLSKLLPKKYGDRLALAGVDGEPIEISKRTLDTSKLSTETLAELMAARDATDATRT